jgi:hypothetical protein
VGPPMDRSPPNAIAADQVSPPASVASPFTYVLRGLVGVVGMCLNDIGKGGLGKGASSLNCCSVNVALVCICACCDGLERAFGINCNGPAYGTLNGLGVIRCPSFINAYLSMVLPDVSDPGGKPWVCTRALCSYGCGQGGNHDG